MGSSGLLLAARLAGASLALSALVTAAGCFGGPAPRDHFYRIDQSQPQASLSQPVLKGTLGIDRFRTDALTRERSILRVESSGSVRVTPYAYQLWVDTPTVILQRDLAEFMRLAGVAERVVLPEMNVEEEYEVAGWIERLVHVTGNDSVVVEMEFSLSRSRGGGQLLRRRYHAEQATGGNDMDSVVKAFGSAVREIFEHLLADIAALRV